MSSFLAGFLAFGAQGRAELDRFGIEKIYADAAAPANNWYFDGNLRDSRFMEQHVESADDGWFRPTDIGEMRVEVLSDPAASASMIPTFDVKKVLTRGYLYKEPNSPDGKGDFLNIEQTWRFRVIALGSGRKNGGPHIELVPGGFRQISGHNLSGRDRAVPESCESMSYHFNIYPTTGRAKFEKDSDHTTGYTVESSDPVREHAVPPFADGREIVEKAVIYRTLRGMKLELYLDLTGTGRRFQKILEYEDKGEWGPTAGGNAECHCDEYVVLSMARVAIGYRCDNMGDFRFKDMSIRSIDPLRPLMRIKRSDESLDSGRVPE